MKLIILLFSISLNIQAEISAQSAAKAVYDKPAYMNLTYADLQGWKLTKSMMLNGQLEMINPATGQRAYYERDTKNPASIFKGPFSGQYAFKNLAEQKRHIEEFLAAYKIIMENNQ